MKECVKKMTCIFKVKHITDYVDGCNVMEGKKKVFD